MIEQGCFILICQVLSIQSLVDLYSQCDTPAEMHRWICALHETMKYLPPKRNSKLVRNMCQCVEIYNYHILILNKNNDD